MIDFSLGLVLFSLVHVPLCSRFVFMIVVLVCFINSSSNLPFLMVCCLHVFLCIFIFEFRSHYHYIIILLVYVCVCC